MRGAASFDRSGQFRYTLCRRWGEGPRRACFCLLNPSTADARRNDPTIRRCIGYAQDWGLDALEVVNIFAFRSTDPGGLKRCADPVGPGNDRAIVRAVRRAELVVLGWGTHGGMLGRGARVIEMVRRHAEPLCLGVTADGHPRHPLYLPRSARPVPIKHGKLATTALCV